jgi:hypothetical protein
MKEFLIKIFHLRSKSKDKKEERPKHWNRSLSDIHDEFESGKRKQVTGLELAWARDYERSQMPIHYRYPKKGDLYEAIDEVEIKFLTSWRAPYTGGGIALLNKGERIWIDSSPNEEKPVGIEVLPVDYKKLELRMVPYDERTAQKYNGFYLSIKTTVLNEKFNLIRENFDKEKFV